jgi:DNA-binding protein YbaB
MFGDLLGNVQSQQKELSEKLKSVVMEESIQDGAIRVKFNASKEIMNVSIDKNKIDLEDTEQIEDLLTIVMNKCITIASQKEAEESQKLMEQLLPGGLSGLSNIFGK